MVIELKTGRFRPEFAGKLNCYVALVDVVLRREQHSECEQHNKNVGILICAIEKDRSVRYSLGRSISPMAVAAYDKLPPDEHRPSPMKGTS